MLLKKRINFLATCNDGNEEKHGRDYYIQENKTTQYVPALLLFLTQSFSRTPFHIVWGKFCRIAVNPYTVIKPRCYAELKCVVKEYDPKNTPYRDFTPNTEIKSQRFKLADLNIRNISKHQDHAAQRHDVTTILKWPIRKWVFNFNCMAGHPKSSHPLQPLSQ